MKKMENNRIMKCVKTCHNTPPLNNPKNLKKRQRKRRMK
jgi:hypothetical protein